MRPSHKRVSLLSREPKIENWGKRDHKPKKKVDCLYGPSLNTIKKKIKKKPFSLIEPD